MPANLSALEMSYLSILIILGNIGPQWFSTIVTWICFSIIHVHAYVNPLCMEGFLAYNSLYLCKQRMFGSLSDSSS